jgi:hypothetical protein
MKRICEWYEAHAALVGAFYSVVPTALWFAGTFIAMEFRGVYVLRLVLALLGGGVCGALASRYAVTLWLARHRSPAGPATVAEAAFLGGAVGAACALFPPLTALIDSNHLELARTFIITAWPCAVGSGLAWGALLGVIARKHIPACEGRGA